MGNIEQQKQVVRRYFAEALDAGNVQLLDELFTTDCIIHRTELPGAPLHGIDAFAPSSATQPSAIGRSTPRFTT